MDYLKNLSVQLGGKIKPIDSFNANFKEKSIRELIIKNHKDFNIEIIEYGDIFEIQIKVESDFTFSINNPEKICGFKKQVEDVDFPFKIYISSNNDNPFLNSDFSTFWKAFSLEIKRIELSKDESVFIYGNLISIALNSKRNVIPILDGIINLINGSDSIFTKKTRKIILSKNIPDKLKHLIPLMKKYSISDDGEREQLIEDIDEKQKKKLIRSVEPFMSEINDFLDSFQDTPLNDAAILLGNLAELVSELQVDNS